MSDVDLSLVVVAERHTDGRWTITCGAAVAEIVPNGDRFGAGELRMPRTGFAIQRNLAESAALALIKTGYAIGPRKSS